ncbi:tRNA pseudouridine synthase-like 1 isoform X1 [Eubalaena glacialis]|uniref:tRNA pseudouridine synthase-like 1 isoform X1 n=1 Tax=Eubalaena glacialis TaxID=27606 RepID=UPI002A5AEA53|nr:tRNA pseudouridine synthase-like 1 isoform X1 [Eubalaena glacialis]
MSASSVRARYLVYFQYLGTDFNGVAAVRGAQHAIGVQNYLEEAAERLNSVVPVKFTISSRTDAGVHALSNAAHLDVQRRSGRPPFSPEVLTQALNTHLRHPAIRVLQAFRVPSHFHARHAATSRTYLYRLVTGCRRPDQLPVFERNRCWALRADCLDVAAMREAAQHLLGTHDFRAFQSAGSPATSPVRTLRRASVSPDPASSPFVLPEESRRLRFWSLEFESQSFLYRQVRRMTSVLVAVGLGALMPAQVKVILESQDPLGRHQSRVAPAHGLFLKAVLYEGFGKRWWCGEVPACPPLTDSPLPRLSPCRGRGSQWQCCPSSWDSSLWPRGKPEPSSPSPSLALWGGRLRRRSRRQQRVERGLNSGAKAGGSAVLLKALAWPLQRLSCPQDDLGSVHRSRLYVPSESTARRSQVTPDTQQGQGSRGTLGPAAGRCPALYTTVHHTGTTAGPTPPVSLDLPQVPACPGGLPEVGCRRQAQAPESETPKQPVVVFTVNQHPRSTPPFSWEPRSRNKR